MMTKKVLITAAIVFILAAIIIWCTSCEREKPTPAPTAERALAGAILASNGTQADVQAKINAAQEGDTVTLPAGTFAWAAHVTVTKGITIKGQTTVDSDAGSANDLTVLQDNLACRGGCPGGEGFFHCTVNAGQQLFRITGITFAPYPGVTTTGCVNGVIRMDGTSTQVRLDHLHFKSLYSANNVAIGGSIRGVSDHVYEEATGQYGQNRAFNGGAPYGDQAFAEDAGYGGPDFFFFEDWYVKNSGGAFSAGGGWDANEGGKYCIRHSKFWDTEILMHATGTMSRSRGGRAQELYNNKYYWSYYQTMDGVSNGTAVWHDNTFEGVKPQGYGVQTYRTLLNYTQFFNGADGRNPWDYNATEADGRTHVDGHPSYVYDSGTISSSSGADPVNIVDTTKNWTPNQWNRYAVRRPSDNATVLIISNTANSLSCRQYSPADQHFTAGQPYEIRRCLRALDQPGSGKGDLLSGATPTPRWLNQVREGVYSWNNIFVPDGSQVNIFPTNGNCGLGPGLQEGLDYFNNTPKPGYTPYVYPHPLVSGGPAPTAAPTPAPTATIAPTPAPTAAPTATSTSTPTVPPTPTATARPPSPTPLPSPTPAPTPTSTSAPTTTPSPGNFVSWAYGEKDKGNRYAYINWSGSTANGFDIRRDGKRVATVIGANDYTDSLGKGGNQTFVYKVCEQDTLTCTPDTPVNF